MSPASMLLGIVVPMAVALAIAALGARLGRNWCAPALAAGYLAGHALIAWPSHDVTDRIPWLALAAMLAAARGSSRSGSDWVSCLGMVALGVLTVWLIGAPARASLGNAGLAERGVAVAVAWVNLEAVARRVERGPLLASMLALTAGAAVVLVASGSLLLGRLGLALAAGLLGTILVPGARRAAPQGLVGVVAAVLTALILEGHIYASLPASGALVIAVAPAALRLTRLGPARRLPVWALTLVSALAILACVGAALALSIAPATPPGY